MARSVRERLCYDEHDRCHGRAYSVEQAIGWMPRVDQFDLEGIDVTADEFEAMQRVSNDELKAEILSQEERVVVGFS